MKKILILICLITSTLVSSQGIRFVDKEYFNASLAIDPGATIKDGLNITPQIELVSYWKYVKLNAQIMPSLEGGYVDFAGSFGVNLTSGHFNKYRAYTGVRLGHIRREKYGYPLVGFEAGIDYNLGRNIYLGIRTTADHRYDYKFSGAKPKMRESGTVVFGTSF